MRRKPLRLGREELLLSMKETALLACYAPENAQTGAYILKAIKN
tara:strand:+ start:24 stop:155 length:132 start_codon:yes stop_codon:yes gene_type:complete